MVINVNEYGDWSVMTSSVHKITFTKDVRNSVTEFRKEVVG